MNPNNVAVFLLGTRFNIIYIIRNIGQGSKSGALPLPAAEQGFPHAPEPIAANLELCLALVMLVLAATGTRITRTHINGCL